MVVECPGYRVESLLDVIVVYFVAAVVVSYVARVVLGLTVPADTRVSVRYTYDRFWVDPMDPGDGPDSWS